MAKRRRLTAKEYRKRYGRSRGYVRKYGVPGSKRWSRLIDRFVRRKHRR